MSRCKVTFIICLCSLLIATYFTPSYAEKIVDPFLETQTIKMVSRPQQHLIIPIHFARAETLAQFIRQKKHNLLSKKGYLIADNRTNRIWLSDDKIHIHLIQQFIRHLDIPLHQLLIKARIVTVDRHYIRSLGVIFGSHLATSPTVASDSGHITIPIAKLGAGNRLDLQLAALENRGRARIISSPKLITNNRHTAIIESGEEIPYQEKTGEGNTSTTFKKAVLRLKVTPEILPKQNILLNLSLNQDKVSTLRVNGVPAIRTQRLTTQVFIHNRHTIVLGGIYEQFSNQLHQGIPWLHKIPILGLLFRNQQKIQQRQQLLIFVTPIIIHNI